MSISLVCIDPHRDNVYDHKLHIQLLGNYQTDKVVECNDIHYDSMIVVDSSAFV